MTQVPLAQVPRARESGRFVDDGERYAVLLAQQFTVGGDGRLAAFRSVGGEVGRPTEP